MMAITVILRMQSLSEGSRHIFIINVIPKKHFQNYSQVTILNGKYALYADAGKSA
jgi:hypothetical protein